MEAVELQPTDRKSNPTRLVHIGAFGVGAAPARALCGAIVTKRLPCTTPVECVVCAEIERRSGGTGE